MYVMPSRCAAKAIGTTGTPTMPNMYSTPCCLRLRAISVAPSTLAIVVPPRVAATEILRAGRTTAQAERAAGP
jgi:hypothetical protein